MYTTVNTKTPAALSMQKSLIGSDQVSHRLSTKQH